MRQSTVDEPSTRTAVAKRARLVVIDRLAIRQVDPAADVVLLPVVGLRVHADGHVATEVPR